MAVKQMKWRPLLAAGLAGVTVAVLVLACDSDAPTAIEDALVDVLANPEGEVAGEGGSSSGVRIRSTLGEGRRPLVFLDGVEVEVGASLLKSVDPDDIESIEVVKGPAAAERYGERAANGIIQILTKGSEASEPAEPSAGTSPPPGSPESADGPGG